MAKTPKLKKPAKKSKAAKKAKKVIALFPEAAFGPASESGALAGIEEARPQGGVPFGPGFLEVYRGYGFEAHAVNLSEPMPAEEMAKFWVDFINGHIPNFRKSPYEQIDNYVKGCWEMIVETSKWAEKDLPGVLAKVKPDVVCVDNVILFPAIKRYAGTAGSPGGGSSPARKTRSRIRTFAASLGLRRDGQKGFAKYRKHFNATIKPIHEAFNAFLKSVGGEEISAGAIL